MKGSKRNVTLVLIGIFVFVGMLGYIFFGNAKQIRSNAPSPAVSQSPTIAVKDFAPKVPLSQKTTLLIQRSDSSRVKYLVPTDEVSIFIKSLPQGSHVISQLP